jgi:hypothetical protein
MIFLRFNVTMYREASYIGSSIGKVYEFFLRLNVATCRGVYVGSRIGKVYEFFYFSLEICSNRRLYVCSSIGTVYEFL